MIELGNYRAKYYYKRTDILTNVFTVCELEGKDGIIIGRGISICSVLDQHIKKKCRTIALGRAIKAIHRKCSFDEIIPERHDEWVVERIMVLNEPKTLAVTKEALDNNLQLIEVKKNEKSGIKVMVPKTYPIQIAAKYFKFKCEYLPESRYVDIIV
jgi:hypothetical protein